jgi:hypothetical protein
LLHSVEPRDEVKAIARLMEFRLRENDWKSHWSGVSLSDLAFEMERKDHQVQLLVGESELSESLLVVRKAVDAANYAMMVVDNWLRKNTPQTEMLIESLRSKDKPKESLREPHWSIPRTQEEREH